MDGLVGEWVKDWTKYRVAYDVGIAHLWHGGVNVVQQRRDGEHRRDSQGDARGRGLGRNAERDPGQDDNQGARREDVDEEVAARADQRKVNLQPRPVPWNAPVSCSASARQLP